MGVASGSRGGVALKRVVEGAVDALQAGLEPPQVIGRKYLPQRPVIVVRVMEPVRVRVAVHGATISAA